MRELPRPPAAVTRAALQGAAYEAGLPPARRKREGVWYTPADLAWTLADRALELLPARRGDLVRACDPACGAGIFLVALRECALRRGVRIALSGADSDPAALAVAASVCPEARLYGGDSLLDLDLGEFDLVLTNPPYVRADAGERRARLRESGRFESLGDKWDLALAFVERGLQLCRPGGLAGYLLANAYERTEYARRQHSWLARKHAVRDVLRFPGLRAFAAGVGSVALFVEREGEGPGVALGAAGLSGPPAGMRLGDLCQISYGLRANSDERRWPGEFRTADVVAAEKDATHPRAYTEGKDLGGLRVMRTRYLEWGTERAPARFARRSNDAFLAAAPKILALCISGRRVRASLDTAGHAFNHTVVGMLPRSDCPFDIRYLLAVLHARRTAEFLDAIRRSDKHVYPDDWREVRVPACNPDLGGRVVAAVEEARALPYPSRAFDSAFAAVRDLADGAFGAAGR
ncbi:MAG: N-6 DNA methylase [Candidatus Sericytochromatia bacterium]|nr:N-6 DNA methylase [Candidatus Tanganyikabacteria bacterium]